MPRSGCGARPRFGFSTTWWPSRSWPPGRSMCVAWPWITAIPWCPPWHCIPSSPSGRRSGAGENEDIRKNSGDHPAPGDSLFDSHGGLHLLSLQRCPGKPGGHLAGYLRYRGLGSGGLPGHHVAAVRPGGHFRQSHQGQDGCRGGNGAGPGGASGLCLCRGQGRNDGPASG